MEKNVKKAAPRKARATTSAAASRPASRTSTAAARAGRAPLAQVLELDHQAIAARAYDLFERSGQPHGRDIEFWLEAERELQVRRKA